MTSIASCTPSKPALVLNTAESRIQLVLGSRQLLLYARQIEIEARAMRVLPPAVQALMHELGLSPGMLDRVAVVRGPGTFTGVRVGISFGLGLARGGHVPLTGIDYLPVLSRDLSQLVHGTVWVCTHARQNLVNVQPFSAPGGRVLDSAKCLSKEQAVEEIQASADNIFILGSGVRRDPEWWRSRLSGVNFMDPRWDHPRVETLLQAAWDTPCTQDYIMPVYLRPSDAELHLERMARDRGVDPLLVKKNIPEFEAR
ncbi:MAG: tRNA (adenosine(37)-N6)-threonylcarbamoyltransferase complex dimerization subunit type 1 TsaB [Desulfovermiculus sp.]